MSAQVSSAKWDKANVDKRAIAGNRLILLGAVTCLLLLLSLACRTNMTVASGARDPSTPAAAPISFYRYDPLAIRIDGNSDVVLLIEAESTVSMLEIELRNGGAVPVTSLGNDTYQATLTHEQVTEGYETGYNHNLFGFLNIYTEGDYWGRLNLVVNVLDENVAAITVTDLAATVRASEHVVNLLLPDSPAGETSYASTVTQIFYQYFADDYEFVNIVYGDNTPVNRSHSAVANDTQGIGLPLFDNTAAYGSDGRLIGFTNYPIHTFFDMASPGSQHELGHQWINFAIDEGSPHWPISELAQGIMGFNIPGTNVGGEFPWELTPDGNGNYNVEYAPDLQKEIGFTDLDLYLMGLLAPEDVEPAIVFENQDQADQLHDGGVLAGPVYTADAGTVVAAHGPRVPGWRTSQKWFKIATIVVTRHRLLSPDEMAFFDYMAARAEATEPVQYQSGFVRDTMTPFYLTTDCLGSLDSTVLPARRLRAPGEQSQDHFVFLPAVQSAYDRCR